MNTTTVPSRESHSSASGRPITVRTTPDFQFLETNGRLTLVELKSVVDTTVQTRSTPLRVPRILKYEDSNRLGFILLQKWEGVVVESDTDTFTAKLIDSHGILETHDATFARSELPRNEQQLIEPGAPFVWILGYRKIGGTRERTSVVYFRRLPGWTEKEITTGHERAKNLSESIGWE